MYMDLKIGGFYIWSIYCYGGRVGDFGYFLGGRNGVGRLGSYKQFMWNMRKGDNLVFDCFIQRWTSKLLKFLFDYI